MEVTGTSSAASWRCYQHRIWCGGGGVTRVLVVFEKWHVKVASEEGDNETAGLVITMGHDEGREQAGLVDGVQMSARDRFYLT